MLVAVAGGTGVAGAEVVRALRARGQDVRVLARSTGVDIVTGAGLDAALDGVDCVVDASNVRSTRRRRSVEGFSAGTTRLLAAEMRAGTRHHVVLSIVGIDRVGRGYYAGKIRQEELALAGPVPVTVLRTTQFHEFAGQMLGRMRRGPMAVLPHVLMQPVAASEVGERLADLAEGAPAGRVPDLAGPERHDLVDVVRRYAAAVRDRTWIVPVRLPGRVGTALATGALLPGPGADIGSLTFGAWLAGTAAAPVEPPRS